MPATRQDISRWYDEAVAEGATHLIVKCDDFEFRGSPGDKCCYPVSVMPGENAHEKVAENSDRTMEVYNLSLDKDEQVGANGRVFNY
jgi:hypothetical protein